MFESPRQFFDINILYFRCPSLSCHSCIFFFSDVMPSANTPNTNKRNTRSNSQTDLTFDSIKILIENSKKDLISSMKDEFDSLKETISSLYSRVEKLEEDNKILLKNYQDLINNSVNSKGKNHQLEHSDQVESVLQEVEQRYARRKNVIIKGLPEEDVGSPSERSAKDLENAHNVFRALGVDNARINEVFRLGRINPDRPRLLRVQCQSENIRKGILRKSCTLRNIEGYKNIFVNKDLTLEEQRQRKLLRDELTRRRNEGENVVIRKGRVVQLDGPEFSNRPSNRENFRQ